MKKSKELKTAESNQRPLQFQAIKVLLKQNSHKMSCYRRKETIYMWSYYQTDKWGCHCLFDDMMSHITEENKTDMNRIMWTNKQSKPTITQNNNWLASLSQPQRVYLEHSFGSTLLPLLFHEKIHNWKLSHMSLPLSCTSDGGIIVSDMGMAGLNGYLGGVNSVKKWTLDEISLELIKILRGQNM